MTDAVDALRAVAPALAFLLAGVPLAALLDELGFFEAASDLLQQRYHDLPVLTLWLVAAATTIVLNLDTTVVLLTPLYVRLARHAEVDPLDLALVPLLLAAFASSVLPISNLTTLIAVDRLDLGVADVVTHLAVPSAAAIVVGWLAYRRRHPTHVRVTGVAPPDRRTLAVGGALVAGLLVAFTVGPALGLAPWVAVVVADVVLVALTRHLPWRSVPVGTAAGVGAVAMLVGALGGDLLEPVQQVRGPLATAGTVLLGAATANVVNNIPATLVVVDQATSATTGVWAWLVGVNVGSVLVPVGALANLLWLRIVRSEGVPVDLHRYVRTIAPVALPALLAAAATTGLLSIRW